jgi:lipopolysaccharide biosynthesis protein
LQAEPKAPIAVFVHVHYPDVWQEISRLLMRRLTVPFHLILTTSLSESEVVVPKASALLSCRVLRMQNRGRDVLPFLRALTQTPDFEIGLKLHTKKSPQREDGAQWRATVLHSLLPQGLRTRAVVRRLRADPRIGMAAPTGFCLSVKPWVLRNAPGMISIMAARGTGLVEDDLDDTFFAAGSMFWFRRSALAGLADSATMELFETEGGQLDGTVAHAMERLFGVEVHRQGRFALAMSALMASRPSMTNADLLALTRRHADIPSIYFPAPNVPALQAPAPSSIGVRLRRLAGELSWR